MQVDYPPAMQGAGTALREISCWAPSHPLLCRGSVDVGGYWSHNLALPGRLGGATAAADSQLCEQRTLTPPESGLAAYLARKGVWPSVMRLIPEPVLNAGQLGYKLPNAEFIHGAVLVRNHMASIPDLTIVKHPRPRSCEAQPSQCLTRGTVGSSRCSHVDITSRPHVSPMSGRTW